VRHSYLKYAAFAVTHLSKATGRDLQRPLH
jgi:hypothetical protein